jgi:hypothetical protein
MGLAGQQGLSDDCGMGLAGQQGLSGQKILAEGSLHVLPENKTKQKSLIHNHSFKNKSSSSLIEKVERKF